jgi:malic enzyme
MGLGVVCCRAKKVTNAMFYAAAKKLASIVPEEDVQAGRVYPDIAKIREVSRTIAIEGMRPFPGLGGGRFVLVD